MSRTGGGSAGTLGDLIGSRVRKPGTRERERVKTIRIKEELVIEAALVFHSSPGNGTDAFDAEDALDRACEELITARRGLRPPPKEGATP